MVTSPSEPPTQPQTTGLASVSSKNRLASSGFESQPRLTQPTRGARNAESRLTSPRSESQLTLFFKSPKSSALPGMVSFTSPVYFLSGVFIVTSVIVTSTPHAREHLHTTNPCTKRKVLSITKPKSKIYKTINDNIKNIPLKLYNMRKKRDIFRLN